MEQGLGRRATLTDRGIWAYVALAFVLVLAHAPVAAGQSPGRATITAGPSGQTTETAARFEFRATRFTALSSFECSLDGSGWTACQSPVTYGSLAPGSHEFSVRMVGPFSDATPDRRAWTILPPARPTPIPTPRPGASPTPTPAPSPSATPGPDPKPGGSPGAKPTPTPKPSKPSGSRSCADSATSVRSLSPTQARQSVLCLLNVERRLRGRAPLRRSPLLERAAARHARDMVARSYFSHVSPSGTRLARRIERVGYLRRARRWEVGEILAWMRPVPTPAGVVEAWMQSPPHRSTLLALLFREAGVGIAQGVPFTPRDQGATFAVEFGRLSGRR